MRRLVLALLFSASAAAAQTVPVGSCEPSSAVAALETDALLVPVRADGVLFWDYSDAPSRLEYLVPKDGGRSPVFAASLWVTGAVGRSVRASATTYGPADFWAGPLPDADDPPADCATFDRVWVVSRADVERYYATGEATADLEDWPAALGAPVLDGDGDPGNYDLEGGDQPDLLGDVAAWWVMHDAGNATFYDEPPLGVEVRGHAFAYERSPFPGVPADGLSTTSFVRYEVVNRRGVPIDSLRVSLWSDVDLGSHSDDYVGTDTLRNTVYAYNADDLDEGRGGYGSAPPAWGVQVLRGVESDGGDTGLTSSMYTTNNGPFGNPETAEHFVNVQRGTGRFGDALYAYGEGYRCPDGQFCSDPSSSPGDPTVFVFPGDPAAGAFWSEVNNDGRGGSNRTVDRRMVLTTGPGRLEAGGGATVAFAFPFARGADHLASVAALQALTGGLLAVFGDGFPSRPVVGPTPPPPSTSGLSRVRPNPSSRSARAVLDLPQDAVVEAAVYDVLGRRVAVAASGARPRGRVVIAVPDGLAPGAYVLRVEVDRARVGSVPFTVVR